MIQKRKQGVDDDMYSNETCKECGKQFMSIYGRLYCSSECKSAKEKRRQRQRYLQKTRLNKKWFCKFCNKQLDRYAKYCTECLIDRYLNSSKAEDRNRAQAVLCFRGIKGKDVIAEAEKRGIKYAR